jgi:hypothetical protein
MAKQPADPWKHETCGEQQTYQIGLFWLDKLGLFDQLPPKEENGAGEDHRIIREECPGIPHLINH